MPLLTIKAFAKEHPGMARSEAAVRWDIYRREHNGLAQAGGVVKAPNGRVYIDVEPYKAWLKSGGPQMGLGLNDPFKEESEK